MCIGALLRHALYSAPPPCLISDCATASPGQDKNTGHCCVVATVAATATVLMSAEKKTYELPDVNIIFVGDR